MPGTGGEGMKTKHVMILILLLLYLPVTVKADIDCTTPIRVEADGGSDPCDDAVDEANACTFYDIDLACSDTYITRPGTQNYYELHVNLEIGDESGTNPTYFKSTNEHIFLDNAYIEVNTGSTIQFGELTASGLPQSGSSLEFDLTSNYCGNGATTGHRGAICGGASSTDNSLKFYDTVATILDSASYFNAIDTGPYADLNTYGEVNRVTYQSASKDTSHGIFYFGSNASVNDYAFYNGFAAIELMGMAETPFNNLLVHDADRGVQCWHSSGAVRGYFGYDNTYDVIQHRTG
jgi:hypothetical protein